MSRLFLALFLFLLIREKYGYTNITLTVNYEKILAEVRKEFLSVSLDTHLIQLNWGGLNFENQRVQRYARNLAPAILRVGGTSADSLYFKPAFGKELASKNILPCYDPCNCDMDYKTVETFNMTARQWHQLANFAQRVGWTLLFDLNVLDRHNGSWTGKNAELLFDYASRKSVGPVYWQLGNEPNILPHFYNRSINPSTLGRDFLKLSTIVKKYKAFQQSLIVGPDVTHPKQDMNSSKPMKYLRAFLQAGGEALDAVSWHHYYFDGRQATADDFVNITHFDSFKDQAKLVCSETRRILGQKKSVWLTETSDGYGGGVRNLSQTFIANFLWLDKLGVSAQQGIELIVRQSFYHGCYGLLNPNLEPTPVYWLSVLHKRLVGTQVFNVSHNGGSKIRFYSHCGNRKSSLVVFGMNLNNFSVGVNFGKELAKVKFRVFIWTEDLVIKGFKDIQNKFVKDISFEMPPKSIAFVKFRKLVGVQACK